MYTKLQQSRITYPMDANLLEVITRHQAGLRLIKFKRTDSELFKKGKEYEVKTLADVIIGWTNGERTIFVNDKTVQCSTNRRRSDLDLFLLCRYYFSMSYKEFSEFFAKLEDMKITTPYGKHNLLPAGYCQTIKRRIYYALSSEGKANVKNTFGKVKLKISKIPNIGERL